MINEKIIENADNVIKLLEREVLSIEEVRILLGLNQKAPNKVGASRKRNTKLHRVYSGVRANNMNTTS